MKSVAKSIVIPVSCTVVYICVLLFSLQEQVIRDSNLLLYLLIGMLVPIVLSIIQGIVSGYIMKSIRSSLSAIILTTLLLGGITVWVTLAMSNNGWLTVLENNSKHIEGLNMSISNGLTFGVILQMLLFVLSGSSLGTFLGNKIAKTVSQKKQKNPESTLLYSENFG